ncbi:MAG: heparan-alpha-glucosaminide N-acetyltransferase domain-containing protein, partial [Promethearchaeota archaeon]
MSTLNENYVNNSEEFSTKKRIASIDFVKGLALGFIIWAHAALSWFDNEWRYIYGLLFSFMDFLGPSLFVFLSALSVIFSIRRKKTASSNKMIRNRIFTRGLVIIVIGALFNPMSLLTEGKSVPFPANLWGWNVLMFIGFSQIFSYYALKFSKRTRAITGFIIIFISPWIREILYLGKLEGNALLNVLHFIITSPLPQVPFLPWIAVCFISTIFGEYLFETMMKGTREAYFKLLRTFVTYGVVLILAGLFIWIPRLGLDQWEPGWALLNP